MYGMNSVLDRVKQWNPIKISKIRNKFLLAFLLMIGLTVGLTVLGRVSQEKTLIRMNGIIDTDLQLTRLSQEIDSAMLAAEVSQRDYLIEFKTLGLEKAREIYVPKFENEVAHAHQLATEVKRLSRRPQGMASVDALDTQIDAYRNVFLKLVASLEKRGHVDTGLEGQFRDDVHNIESRVQEAQQTELEIIMLNMRRREKDYLLRGAEKYVQNVRQLTEQFKQAASAAKEAQRDKKQLLDLADSYLAGFLRLVQVETEIEATKSVLQEHVNTTNGILRSLRNESAAHEQKSRQQITAIEHTLRVQQIGGAVVVVVLGVFLALLLSGNLTRQVNGLVEVFNRIVAGDFDARAKVMSQDEFGQMASSLNYMLDNTLSMAKYQAERDTMETAILKLLDDVSDVAQGDLTAEAQVSEDVTGALADSFNYMIHELRRVVSHVQEVALQVSSSANEIQATTEHLAEGSTAQASQIVDSSAALDEMAVSIQQVSENASLSASVADQALSNAKEGALSVRNTIEGMHRIRNQVQETSKRIKRLGERSQEIGEIVQLIGDIADRTSILALNASIQAARAGEAGRSFVVVAEEVERLAERAANATKQIAGLVNTIQSETNEAVTAMEESTREVVQGSQVADQAGQALNEIEGVSTRLAELIQSISLAASQQARGSEGLSKAMGEISEVTQQTATGTKQAAVSIHALAGMADELRASVSTFKLPNGVNGHRRETVGAYN
jgi:twitching motility protein PilJ